MPATLSLTVPPLSPAALTVYTQQLAWLVQGTSRFIREAVAPGGQELVGAGVGLTVGVGPMLGAAVGGAEALLRAAGEAVCDAVGTSVTEGVRDADGDADADADATATAGLVAGAPPENGGRPSPAVMRIPRARMTRPTPAMVNTGIPVARCSCVDPADWFSLARSVPRT